LSASWQGWLPTVADMRTVQEAVLGRIEEIAEEKGLEPTISKAWANSGRIIFTEKGHFEPKANLSYSFQDAYATFAWRTDGEAADYFDSKAGNTKIDHVTYAKADEIERFLKTFAEDLPAQDKAIDESRLGV